MNQYTQYIIIGIWQLISVLWLSVVLFSCSLIVWYIGKRKHLKEKANLHIGNMILLYLLLLYALTILKITGVIGMQVHLSWFVDAICHIGIGLPFVGSSFLMILLNFLLFVPYGFLLAIVFKCNNWRAKNVILVGIASSLVIEFLQLFGGRMFELDDLIMNTFGTCVGYQIWSYIHGIRVEKVKIKYVIKGIATILCVALLFFGLSFIANGDATQEKEDAMYSNMGSADDEIEDVSGGVLYLNGVKKEIKDITSYCQLYRRVGENISNNASSYTIKKGTYKVNDLVNKLSGRYIEITLKHPHDFTFYNNHDLKLKKITHILYDLDQGILYYGDKGESAFFYALVYIDKEHPVMVDEQMEDEIKQIK